MPDIRNLEGESSENLYKVFMEAFSDYSQPITWSREDFEESNARRGLDLSLSLGAYEDGRMLGFILNGRGSWAGKPAAYDLGTGVLPGARGSGLAGLLAGRLVSFLGAKGFQTYVLEVLRDNAAAIRTYEKAGFRVTRRFECPRGSFADPGKPEPRGLVITDLPGGRLFPRDRISAFRGWEPSWQNSDDSVERTPGKLVVLGALMEDRLVAYLVAGTNGSIWQLAVAPELRRRGLGTALLRALAARVGPELRYINVQADDEASLALLASCGVAEGPGQFEMTRELTAKVEA
jgi:ribosomal protein S18 acetylase RimI-like enzyme